MELRLIQYAAIVATAWSFFAGLANAGAIAAWNPTPYAPQIIMQDDDTGRIFHSICNNQGSTIFPNSDLVFLDVDQRLLPRRTSRIAGVGWWTDDGEWAAVQWQTTTNAIVHSLWLCNSYGHFEPKGAWIISDIAPSVKPYTGLASVILGKTQGYRVYYQDKDNATCALSYSVVQGVWKYDGIVSHDAAQGVAMSAAWTTPENIHVARSRTGQNIEVAKLHKNVTWDITTFPTPLNNVTALSNNSSHQGVPSDNTTSTLFALNTTSSSDWELDAWSGNTSSISYMFDSQNKSSTFYIGTDAQIHQVEEVEGKWQRAAQQQQSIWPPADKPNGELGATYNVKTGEAWLFYMSNGTMVSAYRSNDTQWQDAEVISKVNTTSSSLAIQDGGLTTQAKIGVGVGIGLGVLAICGVVVFLIVLRRRQAKEDEKKWQETPRSGTSELASTTRSTSSASNGFWPKAPGEAYFMPEAQSQPIHELENQVWSHELPSPERHELAEHGGQPQSDARR